MNKYAVFHQAKSSFCYVYENEIHLRIKCAKSDVKDVTLIYGDKYEWKRKKRIKMFLSFTDSMYDYFTIKLPVMNRFAYYFLLHSGNHYYNYTEFGFKQLKDEEEEITSLFHYPYLNKIDFHQTPDWVKTAVFYQIFPERFANGDSSINPENISEWHSEPKSKSYHGGDLRGIINNLDYLENLGITALYLTPIFKANTNHKYDTEDYMEIDPHFGSKDDLKELVEKAHSRNIRIVLDIVFNHSGNEFFAFKDLLENQEKSKYKDWFMINEFPIDFDFLVNRVKEKGWDDWHIDENSGKRILPFETFANTPFMPKLNTSNPEVIKYLLDVTNYWLEEFNIDGYRLDVANEIDHEFWREFRKTVKNINPNAYIVGEIWHDSTPWLRGEQYDAVMNYSVTQLCIDYFAKNSMSAKKFQDELVTVLMRYSQQVNESMLNLLDSHDTARFINRCSMDRRKLMITETFLFTFIGAPMLYYGSEIGMNGENDPDCRKAMIWDETKWDMELKSYIEKLIKIRKENLELTNGDIKFLKLGSVVSYERIYKNQKILLILNASENKKKLKLPTEYDCQFNLISGKKVSRKMVINPYEALIIKLEA